MPFITVGQENTADTIRQAILDDRPAWLTGLLGDFLNLDELLGQRVSEETVRNNWNAGADRDPAQSIPDSRPTLTLQAGDPFLMSPRLPHNALDVGPGTGQMLSTYIVEIGQPLATFVAAPAELMTVRCLPEERNPGTHPKRRQPLAWPGQERLPAGP
jgi:hypothetical protein